MVINLDREDAELRYGVVAQGLSVINNEGLFVPEYSDEVIAEFVGGYCDLQGSDTRCARKLLTHKINGETMYRWIKLNRSFGCLLAMYEFSNYCDWLAPKEIVLHFGKKLLCMFRALQGDSPNWHIEVPFHLILQVAFVRANKERRENVINKYLDKYWDEAEGIFDGMDIAPNRHLHEEVCGGENRGLIEESHVYTVYRRRQREMESAKVKEYMKKGVQNANA